MSSYKYDDFVIIDGPGGYQIGRITAVFRDNVPAYRIGFGNGSDRDDADVVDWQIIGRIKLDTPEGS